MLEDLKVLGDVMATSGCSEELIKFKADLASAIGLHLNQKLCSLNMYLQNTGLEAQVLLRLVSKVLTILFQSRHVIQKKKNNLPSFTLGKLSKRGQKAHCF